MARKKSSPFLYQFSKSFCYVLFRLIWGLKVHGQGNVPKTGAIIIAANHRSYADPPLLGATAGREVHFMAKKELFSFGPFGWLISRLNAHPLNRGAAKQAIMAATSLLEEGKAVILFPEGRRSKTDTFGPPKGGVGLLGVKTKTPIIPTYIHNSGYLKTFQRVSISFGPPIDSSRFDRYEELAEEVMSRIKILKKNMVV